MPAGPAPHSSAAQSNITRARSMLCGRYAPSHAGHGNTLGASCCRTCSRLCTKYGGRGVVRRALRNRSDPGGRPATAHSARAQRSRAEDTHRGPATGQRSRPLRPPPPPRASASGPPLHSVFTPLCLLIRSERPRLMMMIFYLFLQKQNLGAKLYIYL